MRVLHHRRIRRFDRQPSRHPQVNEKAISVIEREDDAFAAAGDLRDRAVGEMSRQIRAQRRDNILAVQRNCANPCTRHARRKRVDDGLNLWQLWHETFLSGLGLYLSIVTSSAIGTIRLETDARLLGASGRISTAGDT